MKKSITFLFLLASFGLLAQQVPRQKVILEVGTGTWCYSCPAVVQIVHDLINTGANVAVIEYHISDPYENAASVARNDFYDFPWYPSTYYDGRHIDFDDWDTYSVHESYYQDSAMELSSFTVAIDGTVGENVVSGVVTVNKVANHANTDLHLYIGLTESNIPEEWHGETEVDFAERAMFPDGTGTFLDFSGGDTVSVPFEIPIHPNWIKEYSELLFFVQDQSSKEIVQGDSVMLDNEVLSNDRKLELSNSYFYPNPVKEELLLFVQDGTLVKNLTITDVLGKTVLKQSDYNAPINMTALNQGIYMLSYDENGQRRTTKLVKQ